MSSRELLGVIQLVFWTFSGDNARRVPLLVIQWLVSYLVKKFVSLLLEPARLVLRVEIQVEFVFDLYLLSFARCVTLAEEWQWRFGLMFFELSATMPFLIEKMNKWHLAFYSSFAISAFFYPATGSENVLINIRMLRIKIVPVLIIVVAAE